jgi:hypothetical protein
MAQHVKILGILHIIYAGFVLAAGVIALALVGGLAGFLSAAGDPRDTHIAPPILVLLGFGLFCFFLALSLPGIVGGFGLLQFKPWARILVIVLSAFELLSVPFGTALGIYGLWVLLNGETERLFHPSPPLPLTPYPR